MKQFSFILAAIALLGQFNHAVAQTAATQGQLSNQAQGQPSNQTQGQFSNQFLTTVIRSSAVYKASIDQAAIKRCCEKIAKDVQRVYFLQDRNGKMKLQVKGVYAHGASIFFWLQLNNRSPLDYDIDSIRFLIVAAGKNRGPASAARALQPVYVYDSTVMVPGRSRAVSIFVLPRFTLSAGQQLLINVQEKNGGRQLRVQATNWTLERARLI
jgi:Domain of unknown function (DUF4138)